MSAPTPRPSRPPRPGRKSLLRRITAGSRTLLTAVAIAVWPASEADKAREDGKQFGSAAQLAERLHRGGGRHRADRGPRRRGRHARPRRRRRRRPGQPPGRRARPRRQRLRRLAHHRRRVRVRPLPGRARRRARRPGGQRRRGPLHRPGGPAGLLGRLRRSSAAPTSWPRRTRHSSTPWPPPPRSPRRSRWSVR